MQLFLRWEEVLFLRRIKIPTTFCEFMDQEHLYFQENYFTTSLLVLLSMSSLSVFIFFWLISQLFPGVLFNNPDFGTIGLSGVSTMIAAIVSQADRKGAIFSVLTIPLFIPFILLLTSITKSAFIDGSSEGFTNDFLH